MLEQEITSPPTATTIQTRVRYAECDPMNVAHHAVYPIWLEMARTELLRQQGMVYRELEARGILFVVVRMSLSYRRPALYDDVLDIHVEALPAKGVKVEHRYEVRRDGELLGTAETTLACVNREGRPQPLPEELRG
ncbi:MAG: acyl-CoA thioesterase [Phycisphaeraceae bacterium]